MDDVPDAELAQRIANRGPESPGAEALLFRRFAPRIELYGLKHLGSRSAAKDLVQDVVLRVVEALRDGRVEEPDRLSSFVLGTCRNVTWDARRSDQRQARIARETAATVDDAAPPPLDGSEIVRLFGCMTALPERERVVLRMSFWEDRAADDIGERLGVSAGNVRVLRHRALGKLVGCMHAEYAA
jgi:RNA polymerase sigma-70 factor, ECF subfamily